MPAPETTTPRKEEGAESKDVEGIGRFLHARADETGCAEKFSRRTRWAVLRLEGEADTQSLYSTLWRALGKEGKRWLSVAEHSGAMWALLYKSDDAEMNLAALPVPATLYGLPREVTAGGPASRAATAEFARAWLGHARQSTSNFTVESDEEQHATAKELLDDCRDLPEEEFLLSLAAAKVGGASPRAQLLRKLSPELKALRSAARKRQAERDFIFRVGENATKLEYPRDIEVLTQKTGRTYNAREGKDELRAFGDYAEGALHLEKVLVLWGPAGRGKTQAARCVAKHLAIGHGTARYVSAGNVDELKAAQHEFEEGVPIILEELGANDVSQHGRRLSANYLKNLLNVPDGGTCRVRNRNVRFHPRQPRILCINDKPEDWLARIGDLRDSDGLALKRRVFFVEADQVLLAPEALVAHDEQLGDVMKQFKRRKLEYMGLVGEPEEGSTTASGGASPKDTPSEASFGGSEASSGGLASSERASVAPPQGAAPRRGFATLAKLPRGTSTVDIE